MAARVLTVLVLLVLAAPAHAAIDLRALPGHGIAGSDVATLAAVGDVDGDGVPDVATGLQGDRRGPSFRLTDIAVIGLARTPPDPAHPAFSGLVVEHLNEPELLDDRFGGSVGGDVAGVGDWDGDGLDDVAFGAVGAGPHRRANAGSVYVVLGRRGPATVDVRTDPRVIRIDGPKRQTELGRTIGAAGDLDGDGRPDLALALPGRRTVIVRGGAAAGSTIDLARPPAGRTIALDLEAEATSFAPAGDRKLLIGMPAAEPLRGRGRALVVGGDRRVLARIVGPSTHLGFGGTVATLPDADGDGQPEWIVGAAVPPGVVGLGGQLASGAFVVFSSARGEVRPGRAGQPVVSIDTAGRGAAAGQTVAGIADTTGDGVPDMLIGLPDASPHCRKGAGAIALVPGRRTPGRVRVGPRGPRLDGPYLGAGIGETLAVAGDDLFVGGLPFGNAAHLELWRVPLAGLAGASPVLPTDCFTVTVAKRSRSGLLRHGKLRVTLRSDVGDGRAHRVRVSAYVYARESEPEGPSRTIAFARAGRRTVTVALPRLAPTLLAGDEYVVIGVQAEQLVGSGNHVTTGAFAADGFQFGRPGGG